MPNATNQTLVFPRLTVDHAGSYRVEVSNPAGQVTSEPVEPDVDASFTFVTDTPITKESAYGVAWGDYDGDGLVDLVTTGGNSCALYHNDGHGIFSVVPRPHPIPSKSFAGDNLYGVTWLDYDNDGRLDLHLATGANWADEADTLFRGKGGGGFAPVLNAFTRQAVVSSTSAWGDFNRDGWLDAFLANLGPGSAARANELWLGHPDGVPTKVPAD